MDELLRDYASLRDALRVVANHLNWKSTSFYILGRAFLQPVRTALRDIHRENYHFCQTLPDCPSALQVATHNRDFAWLRQCRATYKKVRTRHFLDVGETDAAIIAAAVHYHRESALPILKFLQNEIDEHGNQVYSDFVPEAAFVEAFRVGAIALLDEIYDWKGKRVESYVWGECGRVACAKKTHSWYPQYICKCEVEVELGLLSPCAKVDAILKSAIQSDGLQFFVTCNAELKHCVFQPSYFAHACKVGSLEIVRFFLDNGMQPLEEHLIAAVTGDNCKALPVLLEHGASWSEDSMTRIFDAWDGLCSQGYVTVDIMRSRKYGCPWNLTRIQQEPDEWPDVIEGLVHADLPLDQEFIVELLALQSSLALGILHVHRYVEHNVEKLPPVDFLHIAAVAASHLDRKSFAELLKVCKSDGRVWEGAALARNYAVLEYLVKIKHTWKTAAYVNWARLCEHADWRTLHEAGSPCTRRYH